MTIAQQIVAMYESTGLVPCAAVVRSGRLACIEAVVKEATGKTLMEHFGMNESMAGGVVGGFCRRALQRRHTEAYRGGHAIGLAVAEAVGL